MTGIKRNLTGAGRCVFLSPDYVIVPSPPPTSGKFANSIAASLNKRICATIQPYLDFAEIFATNSMNFYKTAIFSIIYGSN
jgi:hypothetical protein